MAVKVKHVKRMGTHITDAIGTLPMSPCTPLSFLPSANILVRRLPVGCQNPLCLQSPTAVADLTVGTVGRLPIPEPPPHALASVPAPPRSLLRVYQPLSRGLLLVGTNLGGGAASRRDQVEWDRELPTISIKLFLSLKQIWQNIKC